MSGAAGISLSAPHAADDDTASERPPGGVRAGGPRPRAGTCGAAFGAATPTARHVVMIDPVDKIRAIVFAAGILAGLAVASVVLSGCTAPRGPLVVTDPDPSVKIPAIKKAAAQKDRKAVRQLVADLSSDDPAVRFYAINGLNRITGERFGYDYFAGDASREAAVRRWQQWLDGRPATEPGGAGNPGTEVSADAGRDR
jgi:hypothetical protein